MGIVAWVVAVIAVSWLLSRMVDGSKAKPLRERDDAKRAGAALNGIGEALPFLGQQTLNLPPPPPAIDFEPEASAHTIVLGQDEDGRTP